MNFDFLMNNFVSRSCTIPIWATLGLLLASGCSYQSTVDLPRVAVEGSVLIDGKPLERGVLRFVPVNGTAGPKTNLPIIKGDFEASDRQGPVCGSHRVEIQPEDVQMPAFDDEQAVAQISAKRSKKPAMPSALPHRYNEQSSLFVTIKPTVDGNPVTLNYSLQTR